MRLFEQIDTMCSGAAQRREAIEEARMAGKQGATRVPDTVLFGYGELTDTAILQLTESFLQGKAEREGR
jgi:hypothetical protein